MKLFNCFLSINSL
ncbi:hypothetical protein SPV_2476 [Streptococcus pneumoniae]|nr:hypothetical protein SPV_2476 [Streptococcus pneumoniae]